MKRSERFLKFANLSLLVAGSTIAIVDIFSLVLIIIPDIFKLEIFIGWIRFYPTFTKYIIPTSLFAIVVILIGYFAIRISYVYITSKQPNMRFGSMAVLIIIFINLLLCSFSFAWLFFQPSDSMLQTTVLDNHIYHLDITTYDAAENQFFYHLSECDSLDFICKEIFIDEQYWLEQKVGFIEGGSEKLLPDPIAHTVTLQINGEAVYVHPVK